MVKYRDSATMEMSLVLWSLRECGTIALAQTDNKVE